MKINFINELSLSPSHLKPKGMFGWVILGKIVKNREKSGEKMIVLFV